MCGSRLDRHDARDSTLASGRRDVRQSGRIRGVGRGYHVGVRRHPDADRSRDEHTRQNARSRRTICVSARPPLRAGAFELATAPIDHIERRPERVTGRTASRRLVMHRRAYRANGNTRDRPWAGREWTGRALSCKENGRPVERPSHLHLGGGDPPDVYAAESESSACAAISAPEFLTAHSCN